MSDRRDAPGGGSATGPTDGASEWADRPGSIPARHSELVGDSVSDQAPAQDPGPVDEGVSITEILLPDTAGLLAERDEYLGALQRLKADFDNYRKRIVRQQEEQSARAAQGLVAKLLPVLDTLDLAQAHLAADLGRQTADPNRGAMPAQSPEALGLLRGSGRPPTGWPRGAAPQVRTGFGQPGYGATGQGRTGVDQAPPAPGGKGAAYEADALAQARSQLLDVLAKEGLERVDEIEVPFDPEVHDAVASAPARPGEAVGLVDEVLRAGYRWRGQVVRPAMVRVRG